MPSLDSLSIGFRRAQIGAFWILTTVTLAGIAGGAAWALGARVPWAWAAASLCTLLPGVVWTQWFEFGVRGWNKATRVTVPALRTYVLKVSYYVLIGSIGRAGSSLDLRRGNPAPSRWLPRRSRNLEGSGVGASHERHGLTAWVRRREDVWMLCLVPVLFLLTVLGDEREQSGPPSGTYTLY
jgi:hypothetical protein